MAEVTSAPIKDTQAFVGPDLAVGFTGQPKKGALKKTTSDQGPTENQILSFVSPKISEEDWEQIATYLMTLVVNAVNERSNLNTNLLTWNDMYEGRVPDGKDFPWPDAANLNVPIIQEMTDGAHARLSKVTLGVQPVVLVKGDDQEGVDVQYKVERYFDSVDRKIKFPDVADTAIFLGLRDGVGLLKVMWEYRTRKVKMRKMVPLTDPDTGEELLNPQTSKIEREEQIVVEDVVEYDNVRCYPVELKDFYLLPSHAYGLQRYLAKGVAERIWLRWDEIWARAQSGQYDPLQVEKLRDMTAASRLYTLGVNFLEQDTIGGAVAISFTPGLQEYEIFEIQMSYDLDRDGYEEECLFTYCPRFSALLRAEILPYWHQLRTYIPIIPWPRPNRFYGFGIPERLESVQRELNAIHNQRLDTVAIRIAPPIFVNRSSVMLGMGQQPWAPGQRFEVNSKDDVFIPTLPDVPPSAFTEETILRQYAERIVGLFDINTPRGTGSRRTRSEIGAMQEEAMIRFDQMAKRIQMAIAEAHEQMRQLKVQYMPDEEVFEAIGPEGGIQTFNIKRGELLANFHFVANGDLPVADKERYRQESYFLYGALMQNPLVMQKPTRIYAVTQQLLQAWESKNIERLIGTVEEVEEEEQQAMMAAQQQAMQPQPGAGRGGPIGQTNAPGRVNPRGRPGVPGPVGAPAPGKAPANRVPSVRQPQLGAGPGAG